jgi:hypothetical protein
MTKDVKLDCRSEKKRKEKRRRKEGKIEYYRKDRMIG